MIGYFKRVIKNTIYIITILLGKVYLINTLLEFDFRIRAMYETVSLLPLAALSEMLWVNLSSESHHLDSCAALRDSARSQQVAADSQRKACESKTAYLVKQV